MSVSTSEVDVIFNKANVALSRSQKLIASWLPPKTEAEVANTKSGAEIQREEDEIFTAVPEKFVFQIHTREGRYGEGREKNTIANPF